MGFGSRFARRALHLLAAAALALGLAGAGCTEPGGGLPADLAVPCDGHACVPGGCDRDDECRVGQRCDTSVFRCVDCLTSADCPMGQVCHPSSHVCLEGCGPGRACSDGGVCEPDAGFCAECLGDGDCRGDTPVCDPARSRCAPCLPTDDRCPALSYCVPQGFGFACKPGCKDDRECLAGPAPGDGGAGPDMAVPDGGVAASTNWCEPRSRACVECLEDAHCPLGRVCVANHCADGCTAQHGCPDPQDQVCCAGQCANLKTDPLHCGACDVACRPGFQCCAGACSDPAGDVANCGSCGVACVAPNGTPLCTGGTCKVGQCDPGRGDCNRSIADGCETDVASNVLACGACGQPCAIDNARPVCAAGKCSIGTCFPPFDDCDKDVKNGCEAKLDADPLHCGGCANACSTNHVPLRACLGARCTGACEGGWADCNGDKLADGCETNVATNVMSCGACGAVCSSVNGTPSCAPMLGCQITCAPLYGDCDKDVKTGCERNLRTLTDCGACGVACTQANAVATCGGGTCQILVCNAGWGDCDKSAGNGCEARTDTDVANCGACGNACSSVNGTPGCAAGRCLITCLGGFADCDRDSADGCEIDTRSDLRHCGACNAACALPHVATNSCTNGACGVVTCQSGWADCNGVAADGCEVDLTADASHCGACGRPCARNHDTPACVASACVLTCDPGFADCKGGVADGCETQIAADAANCGACNAACALPHVATHGCAAFACTVVACQAGFADCNGVAADGCEVNTTNDPIHCAGCGKACSTNHATPACVNSACVLACDAGWQSCDGSAANGCETGTASDPANCGACGAACSNAGITPLCLGGACAGACAPGFADCNNDKRADGCEAQTATDKNNCGACGTVCPSQNGAASCVAGACRIACAAGFADCDGNLASGCETSTATSATNCGACGKVCSAVNGAPSCANGACQIACKPGFGDCDGDVRNGCEAPLDTLANCGACGTACGPVANGSATCQTRTCAILACNGGFADCNGNPGDGCETATNADKNNCGGCGVVCPAVNGTASCGGGRCNIVCGAGFADCNGNPGDGCETRIADDRDNCGACGVRCSTNNVPAPTCANGLCTGACAPGFADCNGTRQLDGCEVSTNTDANNCGACTTSCAVNKVLACVAGACTGPCLPGYGDCDGNKLTNGCETDITTSVAHCGACGNACPAVKNATPSCAGGACLPNCGGSFADCDKAYANGCEIDTNTDVDNCGKCGRVCPAIANGLRACTLGVCAAVCTPGFGDCKNGITDGCETNLLTDANNCNGCGVVCPSQNGTAACVNGACTLSCNAGFRDCDGLAANGCERNVNTDPDHCGACGQACSGANMATRTCGGGVCNGACNAGFADCNANKRTDGCEKSTNTDPDNCGACGSVCSASNITTRTCAAGVCNGTCTAGFADCNGNKLADGCERSTNTDPDHCGGCGIVCSASNIATRTCAAGVCNGACTAGFADCNANKRTDGCEKSTATDPDNCGGCGTICSSNHVPTRTCTAGSCSGVCAAGWSDCNTNKLTDGCEINTAADPSNCGTCGKVCALPRVAMNTCTAGACTVGTCTAGYADCDASATTGCETHTAFDWTHCGACSGGNATCAVGKTCNAGTCVTPANCVPGIDIQSDGNWVVCKADVTGVWISATDVNVLYHAGQICKQLNFPNVLNTNYGTNCGNICGDCADGTIRSCGAPGPNPVFDQKGTAGMDANGLTIQSAITTVHWKCTP